MQLTLTSPNATGSNCLISIIHGRPSSIWTTLQKPQTYCSNSPRTKKTALHRDVAAFHTFALQGEHRIYSSLGDFKEGRTVGTDKIGQPDVGPHAECEGDSDVIILCSLRSYHGGLICEIPDENREVLSSMTFDGSKELHMAALASEKTSKC